MSAPGGGEWAATEKWRGLAGRRVDTYTPRTYSGIFRRVLKSGQDFERNPAAFGGSAFMRRPRASKNDRDFWPNGGSRTGRFPLVFLEPTEDLVSE